jgi:hypothetical protein
LVRDAVNAGRLTASVSLAEALARTDVALICERSSTARWQRSLCACSLPEGGPDNAPPGQ